MLPHRFERRFDELTLSSPAQLLDYTTTAPRNRAKISTALFYGLFFTAPLIYFAVQDHTRLKPVFLALDLVLLRRGQGTLISSSKVDFIPEELWELVRELLRDEEAAVAEPTFLGGRLSWSKCRLRAATA